MPFKSYKNFLSLFGLNTFTWKKIKKCPLRTLSNKEKLNSKTLKTNKPKLMSLPVLLTLSKFRNSKNLFVN